MVRRTEITIALGVVALAVVAVWSQLDGGGAADDDVNRPPAILPGEALSPDIVLTDLQGRRVRMGDLLGARATVLYAWSTTCPCIPDCEDAMRTVSERFGADEGVRWIGIDGESTDTSAAIAREAERIGCFYPVLRDPTHRLCSRIGFDRAAVVAVLDEDGYLRFRGNPTDDLDEPTRNHLLEVLPAILEGGPSPLGELAIGYGCPFSDPLAECPDDEVPAGEAVSAP